MKKESDDIRLSFRKGDAVAVAAVLLLAALVFAFTLIGLRGGDGCVAVVSQNGETLREIDLDALTEPLSFEIDGDYHCVVRAEPGRICIESSDCPSQSCVRTGWISQPGQTVVCLPNRVEIRITGSGGVDVVAG